MKLDLDPDSGVLVEYGFGNRLDPDPHFEIGSGLFFEDQTTLIRLVFRGTDPDVFFFLGVESGSGSSPPGTDTLEIKNSQFFS